MYLPPATRQDDPAALHALMREHGFAALVTHHGGGTSVSHLPFLIDAGSGPNGTLVAHMARANPHWKEFEGAPESVVIFTGPHAYVSPSWYEQPQAVPTWTYAVAHAYGRPAVVEDEARAREIVMRLVERHEAPLGKPWDAGAAAETIGRQLAGIVAFEMRIERLEGKFKLNQGRSRADREGVIRVLEASGDARQREVAAMMKAVLERPTKEAR